MEQLHKGALREYTLLGISPVFKAIVSQEFIDFFDGKSLRDILIVIRHGDFYHFQMEEDVASLGKAFLTRITRDHIDPDALYNEFETKLLELEAIFRLDIDHLSPTIIQRFFLLYAALITYAYAAAYSFDAINILTEDQRKRYAPFIEKMRLRAENIYKFGEKDFVPMLSRWLAQELFPTHSSESLLYLLSDELLNSIENNASIPSEKELMARKELFYCKFLPLGTYTYSTKEEARNSIDTENLFAEIDRKYAEIDTFSGTIAFPGILRGTVRIIKKKIDTTTFQTGEIIVSPMTDPSYVPIMKSAAAFITDEGGALCHAAIVARELQKPCITGTKIATKVLHNGDFIEVDANNGIIKVLNRIR